MARIYRTFARTMLLLITAGSGSGFTEDFPPPDFSHWTLGGENVSVVSIGDAVPFNGYTFSHEETDAAREMRLLAQNEISERQNEAAHVFDEMKLRQNWSLLAQADAGQRQGKDREAWEAYQKAYALVLEEKWKEAANSLSEVERKYSGSSWVDDAKFWNIYSLEKSGRNPVEILRLYEDFLGTYRGSRWESSARANFIALGNRLAASGKPEYAEKVRAFAEHDQIDVSLSALIALQNMGEESLPDIIRLYDTNASPEIRERILASLNVLHTPKQIDFLIRIAETDPTPRIRHKALNLLGTRIAPFPLSMDLFGAVSPERKTTANFRRTSSPASQLSEENRTKIIDAVRRIFKKDTDENVRAQAISLIGQAGISDADMRLAETAAKTDPSLTVRTRALMGLWAMPESRGLPAIIAVAKSNADVNTRKMAIHYLGQSKDPRARAALVEIAAGDK